jgi:ribonuclease HI
VNQKAHGVADLAEFRARLDDLRLELEPPNGPGGWAAVVEPSWELFGHLSSTSNNRAEALGMLAAIEWVPAGSSLVIRSDSELTVKVLQGVYKARANLDIWTEINRARAERQVKVTTVWLRGHAGDPGNERADALSVLGAKGKFDLVEAPVRRRTARALPPELANMKPQTPWETEFLSSVARQLRGGKALSPKQQAIVDRIRGRG